MHQVKAEEPFTGVLITHDLEVAAYAQRVITMSDGQIISDQQQLARAV
jgi:ABC-type lipoprotein export system ATPase subunit